MRCNIATTFSWLFFCEEERLRVEGATWGGARPTGGASAHAAVLSWRASHAGHRHRLTAAGAPAAAHLLVYSNMDIRYWFMSQPLSHARWNGVIWYLSAISSSGHSPLSGLDRIEMPRRSPCSASGRPRRGRRRRRLRSGSPHFVVTRLRGDVQQGVAVLRVLIDVVEVNDGKMPSTARVACLQHRSRSAESGNL